MDRMIYTPIRNEKGEMLYHTNTVSVALNATECVVRSTANRLGVGRHIDKDNPKSSKLFTAKEVMAIKYRLMTHMDGGSPAMLLREIEQLQLEE